IFLKNVSGFRRGSFAPVQKLRILRFPDFLSTLNFKFFKSLKTKFYLTPWHCLSPRNRCCLPCQWERIIGRNKINATPFLLKTAKKR
ncbi:hypothetical protein CWC31_14700, partial [Pseudoalteromonas ruthenica]